MAKQCYVNISLSLPVGVWEVIGTTAAENGTSPGALVVQALEERYGALATTPNTGPGAMRENPNPASPSATSAPSVRRRRSH